MKNILVYLLIFRLLASSMSLKAQLSPETMIRVDVVYLASDDLEGRQTGTVGEAMAADYISERMLKMGLSPKGSEEWFQAFKFNSNPHGGSQLDKMGKNVIGFLDKKQKDSGDWSTLRSFGIWNGRIFTSRRSFHSQWSGWQCQWYSSIIVFSRPINEREKLKFNVLFIAFSGEEYGLYGSKAFMENPTVPKESIFGMINMDMVGRLNKEKL